MRTYHDVLNQIRLRTNRVKITEEQKKQQALDGVLRDQQDYERGIPQGSVFRPGEGNLAAPVALVVWSAEELAQVLDKTSSSFDQTAKAIHAAGLDWEDIWFTCIKKYTAEEHKWASDAADAFYCERELDIIKPTVVLACGYRMLKVYFGISTTMVTNVGDMKTQRHDSGRITTYIATYSPSQLQSGGSMAAMFGQAVKRAYQQAHYVL